MDLKILETTTILAPPAVTLEVRFQSLAYNSLSSLSLGRFKCRTVMKLFAIA